MSDSNEDAQLSEFVEAMTNPQMAEMMFKDAKLVVDSVQAKYIGCAMPALLEACITWAFENDLVEPMESLMEGAVRHMAQIKPFYTGSVN